MRGVESFDFVARVSKIESEEEDEVQARDC